MEAQGRETPFRGTPPRAPNARGSLLRPHGLAVQGPSRLQPLVSGPEAGGQGLGLSPRPPSGRPLEQDWEGGQRKPRGARGHSPFGGPRRSRQGAGYGIPRPSPFADTHHSPLL